MNYRITELPQFHLTGPMLRTSVADNEREKSIPKFCQSLMASGEFKTICALAQPQVFPDGTTFGVNAPDPENENGFLYYVAVELAPLTATDYPVVTVAPGQWAVFSAVGEPSVAIPAVFRYVKSEFFANSEFSSRREEPELEVYSDAPIDENYITEVWFPIQPKASR